MKLTKKIITFICTAALMLLFAGCNSGESGETTTTAAAEAPEETTAAIDLENETAFTIDGGITDTMIQLSRLNEGNKARLAKVVKKAQGGEDITVAYLGGSITQGTSAGNDLCYAKLTSNWLQEQFPDITVNYINAGIGATGSYIGVHRADRDVIANNPDLVFVEFSVNDTTENTQRNINSYDSLLRKLWNSASSPALICIGMTQQNGTSFQEQHAAVAKSYDLPFISYKDAILHVIDKGFIDWTDISDDNIHPNVPGHKILADLIDSYIGEVIANADSIDTAAESDFSTAYTDDIYKDATLLTPANLEPTEMVGFTKQDDNFGNFNGYWRMVAKDGKYDGAKLSFEITAKTIGLFYGEMVRRGGQFEVAIDGETVATVDGNFPNGWGNYVEAVELKSFEESGTHKVEIIPVEGTTTAQINISAFAIS